MSVTYKFAETDSLVLLVCTCQIHLTAVALFRDTDIVRWSCSSNV